MYAAGDRLTWMATSARRVTIKAALRFAKPDVQKPAGMVVELSPYPAVTESDHNWPPFSHSHWILSSLYTGTPSVHVIGKLPAQA